MYVNTQIIGIPRTNSMGKIADFGYSVTDNLPNSEETIHRGEYPVIRSLIRVLEVNEMAYFQLS